MRYDLVIFDLDVLTNRNTHPFVDATLQELTDLGATLGLISGLSQSVVRDLLGSSQQHFDSLECGPGISKTEKVVRIVHHLEFSCDRALVVAADAAGIAAVDKLGVSSAILDPAAPDRASVQRLSILVVTSLSDVVDIISGRPILRVVR